MTATRESTRVDLCVPIKCNVTCLSQLLNVQLDFLQARQARVRCAPARERKIEYGFRAHEQGRTVQRRALRFLSKNIGSWQTLHAGMRHTLQVRYCIRNILTNKEADRWPEYMSSRLAKKIRSVTWQRCRLGLSAAKLLATQ